MKQFTPEQYEDAILTVTGLPEWEVIQNLLFNEVQQANMNGLFLESWEKVNEEKGFVRGLMYVVTLREQLKTAKKQREADANL